MTKHTATDEQFLSGLGIVSLSISLTKEILSCFYWHTVDPAYVGHKL